MRRFFLLFFLLILTGVLGEPAQPELYAKSGYTSGRISRSPASGGYDITGYHVEIDVGEDNVYHIREDITVDFHQSLHEINRYIPLTGSQHRTDGSGDTVYHGKIKNIDCGDEPCEVKRENGLCTIRLGDEDETVQGIKKYKISYDYIYGKDLLENIDDFYWNLIGDGWTDTTISGVSFVIRMPKAFDSKNVYLYSGNNYAIHFDVTDNIITGEMDSRAVLYGGAGQGVTVRVILPDGYFTVPVEYPLMAYFAILFCLISVGVGFFLWWIYGRDDAVVETVEFHPPDGLNSLETAYAYRGDVTKEDAVALMIDLADKGYIEIEEKGTGDFTLIIKKPYDGNNDAERIFMGGLTVRGQRVSKNELKNSFYQVLDSVASIVETQQRKVIYHASSLNKSWILYLLSVIMYFFAGVVPLYEYSYSLAECLIGTLGTGLLFTAAFALLVRPGRRSVKILPIILSLVPALITLIGAAYICFSNVERALAYASVWYRIAYYVAIAASFVVILFAALLPRRTPYGTELLGKIRGFRNFLETAEKEKLELLVEEDPQYFYKILPYAYVLNVSEKWMKKFEDIATVPPEWYSNPSSTAFHMHSFHHFMDHTMSSARSAMTSQPNSGGRGGGGSVGGGFSGGGAGGGGGGAW